MFCKIPGGPLAFAHRNRPSDARTSNRGTIFIKSSLFDTVELRPIRVKAFRVLMLVNRALQKAADDELDALEITGVKLRKNSCLEYVAIFAGQGAVRREPILALLDTE